jgi:hypothetical protein
MKKKEIPYSILQQMNEFKTTFPGVSKIVEAKDCLLRYEDSDDESDFFFQINSFAAKDGGYSYSITYKPTNEDLLVERTKNVNFPQATTLLENWGNVIKKFNETDFFIDDPITAFYTQEFYAEYKIIDEDADISPFEIKRQILIDLYLENSIKFLENYEAQNGVDLTESKNIALELKNELTDLTKNQVMLRLSRFWAVTRKKGLPILQKVFFELAKEILKEFGKKMLGL